MSRFMFIEFLLNNGENVSSCDDYVDRLFALLSNIQFDFSIVHAKQKIFLVLKNVATSDSLSTFMNEKDVVELLKDQALVKEKFIKSVIDDGNKDVSDDGNKDLMNKIAWSFTVILFHTFSPENMKLCYSLLKDMLKDEQQVDMLKFKHVLESLDCLVFPDCFSRFDFRIKQTLNLLHLVFFSQSYCSVHEAITILKKDPNWFLV